MTPSLMETAMRTVDEEIAWLLAAATNLDQRGEHGLAEAARYEASAVELRRHREAVDREAARLRARDAAMRCEMCGFKVSEATARQFDAVDWVICQRCREG